MSVRRVKHDESWCHNQINIYGLRSNQVAIDGVIPAQRIMPGDTFIAGDYFKSACPCDVCDREPYTRIDVVEEYNVVRPDASFKYVRPLIY